MLQYSNNERINAGHQMLLHLLSDILPDSMLGDKEIAVKIRGNSHYRNLRGGAISRNAYRSAVRGRLLGK